MKHKLTFFAIVMMALAIPQSVKAYDFSYTYQGQTLYYNIVDGMAQVAYQYLASYSNYSALTGSLEIPDTVTYNGTNYSVTSIGDIAFAYCSGLTSVTIGNSVTSIGDHAFEYCSGLTSVTIPDSVTYIGQRAFANCSGLTSITIPNAVTTIGAYAFYECSGLTSVTIPDAVTSIGSGAFHSCSGLTSVTIGNAVTSIGYEAFYGCSGLTSVAFNADRCTSAGYSYDISAFYGCTNIANFTFGDNVKVIPKYLCYGLSGLTSVTIPDAVTSIGNRAFYGCSGLDTVYLMPATPPTLGDYAFSNNHTGRVFVLNDVCSYDNYYTSSAWYSYRLSFRYPIIDINVDVLSSNTTRGTASIIQQNGHDVRCDSTVVISATASNGYHFDHWSNGNTANPDTLHLVGDSIVTAFFAPNQYVLTVQSADESLGSVAGSGTYNYLDTVAITATAIGHHHLVCWSDGNSDNPRQVVISCDTAFTAIFAIDTYTVNVVPNNPVRGMVTQSGTEFTYLAPCTVEATAYSGYTFAGWSNGMRDNPYTFALLSDVELTALFVEEGEEVYTVTVVSADPTMGTVSGGGQSLDGGTVVIRATGNPGYRFVRWNDNNTDSVRTVEVHSNVTYTAYFEALQGIDDVAAKGIRMYAGDGEIVLEGSEGMAVSVYDMMGRKVFSMAAAPDPCKVAVLQRGVYLVKVGNLPARKVVVVR